MRNSIFLLFFMPLFYTPQVGINTSIPNNTLTVAGSFSANYREVTATSTTLSNTDYYVSYNGTSAGDFTLPAVGINASAFTGRIYRVKNQSPYTLTLYPNGTDKLRPYNSSPVASISLSSGAFAEVVNNMNASGGNTWDVSYIAQPTTNNVEIYGTQVKIPPHAAALTPVADWSNHTNSSYDTSNPNDSSDTWWIISKSSVSAVMSSNSSSASRMMIVYEYQGTPFNLTNLYPILTNGNSSSYPDVYSPSFISLANNGTSGKTRLTVSVTRVDLISTNAANLSNWAGTFLLNLLLARRTN